MLYKQIFRIKSDTNYLDLINTYYLIAIVIYHFLIFFIYLITFWISYLGKSPYSKQYFFAIYDFGFCEYKLV